MAVLVFGITCPRSFHGPLSLGSGLLVPRPDETALDAPRAIMSEDHESAGSRDIVGIIGLPFRFQPLDLSLKLAKPRVHMVRKFVGRLVPFGQLVDLAPSCR
jgi:hypothetical protein